MSKQSPKQSKKFSKNKVILQDCIEGMKNLKTNSIGSILADPPYNLSKGAVWKWDNSVKLKGMGGDWHKLMENWDDMSFSDYWKFTLSWLKEAKRVIKPNGSMWICGTYHNIGIINTILQILEIEIINEIIWFKRNAFPNLSGRRFTASHENILWCHAGKNREYNFNYNIVKNMEFSSDNIKKKGKQMRTVWDIPNNKPIDERKFGTIPSQKPISLISRMILSSTYKNTICLIPFAGAGTECISALRCGRKFIAFENNNNHYKLMINRIKGELKCNPN